MTYPMVLVLEQQSYMYLNRCVCILCMAYIFSSQITS